MKSDILASRKCIHIKLNKGVHASLRALMFKHGLSMQEVFEDFAKALVTEDSKATRLLEELVVRKLQESLENLKRNRKDERVDELDHDALYNMINQKEKSSNEAA
jgi:uncharacterized protein YaaW (UPF0174 family)